MLDDRVADEVGDSGTRRIGAVAIGRNEGERLGRCLAALSRETERIVYVDSGSTDGSPELARGLGVDVLALAPATGFTAARARNAGFHRLRRLWPDVELVQFVDGDMELARGWLATAAAAFAERPDLVALGGIRRERHPDHSVYNRVCDVEWRIGGAGDGVRFGGDVMVRASSFAEVGGYAEEVIAAEDDELAIRLQSRGGVIARIDAPSSLHDADMHEFAQWWTRARRCGHAYAQVQRLRGGGPAPAFERELRRTWLFGAIVPGGVGLLTAPTLGLSWLLLALYPLNALRIAIDARRRGFSWRDAGTWGAACALSPIPQAMGALEFHAHRLRARRSRIIEHKRPRRGRRGRRG